MLLWLVVGNAAAHPLPDAWVICELYESERMRIGTVCYDGSLVAPKFGYPFQRELTRKRLFIERVYGQLQFDRTEPDLEALGYQVWIPWTK